MNGKKSKLSEAVERFKAEPNDPYLPSLIGQILKAYSIDDTWVYTVTGKEDPQILTHTSRGKEYIPIFSDEEYVEAKGNNVLLTGINKLILPLISDPGLGGLEIDPFSIGLCVQTGQVLEWIFGKREFYPLVKKDWGKGIPEYSESDIMDERMILDFAIQAVGNSFAGSNISGIFCTNELDAVPNIIIRKDDSLAFGLVEGGIIPDKPKLSYEKRKLLIERSKHFGLDCYYAPVAFGSADPLRSERSLALRGDAYYADFKGLEKVSDLDN